MKKGLRLNEEDGVITKPSIFMAIFIIIDPFAGFPAIPSRPDQLYEQWCRPVFISQFLMQAFHNVKKCIKPHKI